MVKQKILFCVIDPLGNKIKLLQETFEKHIIVRHPEMRNHVVDIQNAITDPFLIGSSTKNKNSIIYLNQFKAKSEKSYIVVAVKYIKKLDKIILTAFTTKNLGLNKINQILWQNPKIKNYITHIPELHKN